LKAKKEREQNSNVLLSWFWYLMVVRTISWIFKVNRQIAFQDVKNFNKYLTSCKSYIGFSYSKKRFYWFNDFPLA
jgi:hypothetical protein